MKAPRVLPQADLQAPASEMSSDWSQSKNMSAFDDDLFNGFNNNHTFNNNDFNNNHTLEIQVFALVLNWYLSHK